MNFGEKLQTLRKSQGMSQEQLANASFRIKTSYFEVGAWGIFA